MQDIVRAVEMAKINYVLVYFLQKFPIKTRSKIYINSYQESTPEERYKQTALEKKGKKIYFPPQRGKAIRRFREVAAFQ